MEEILDDEIYTMEKPYLYDFFEEYTEDEDVVYFDDDVVYLDDDGNVLDCEEEEEEEEEDD